MPIQFIAGSYKGVAQDRQSDVYRMLHLAFDYGYLFEADELEAIWLAQGTPETPWISLPKEDKELWHILQKSLGAEIAGLS